MSILIFGGFLGNDGSEGAAKTDVLLLFFWPFFVLLFYAYCLFSVKLFVVPVYKFFMIKAEHPSAFKLMLSAFVIGWIYGLAANVILIDIRHIRPGFMIFHAFIFLVEAIACWLFDNFPKEQPR